MDAQSLCIGTFVVIDEHKHVVGRLDVEGILADRESEEN
jgi:hypothetical protein